ncbi:MAG: hypothetical protein ACR2GL_03215 [Thermoleophilaceae bacterium]
MRSEAGQATVEWVGLVLLAALLLGGVAAVAGARVDGRSFGGFLTHRIFCAVRGGCEDGAAQLAGAYGRGDAELLRRYAPDIVYEPGEAQLPVDWRECRKPACADAPDDRDLDVHRTNSGRRATVFTRVVRRDGRTYLQYWFYYPDSNSTVLGSDKLWNGSRLLQKAGRILRGSSRYPGYHPDDWESYQVRIGRRGGAAVRSSSHGHYQWCKRSSCANRWGSRTGWTRVSRGSHAGHIPIDGGVRGLWPLAGTRPDFRSKSHPRRYRRRLPGRELRERTTTSEGIRLIPLETLEHRRYRPLDDGIKPPWRKRVYSDPESDES